MNEFCKLPDFIIGKYRKWEQGTQVGYLCDELVKAYAEIDRLKEENTALKAEADRLWRELYEVS